MAFTEQINIFGQLSPTQVRWSLVKISTTIIIGGDHWSLSTITRITKKQGRPQRISDKDVKGRGSGLWVCCENCIFLAVQNSSIGDLVPWSLAWAPLTIREFTTLQSDPRDLWDIWSDFLMTIFKDSVKRCLYLLLTSEGHLILLCKDKGSKDTHD